MLQEQAICIFKKADYYDHVKAHPVTFNDLVYHKMMQIMYVFNQVFSSTGVHILYERCLSVHCTNILRRLKVNAFLLMVGNYEINASIV